MYSNEKNNINFIISVNLFYENLEIILCVL